MTPLEIVRDGMGRVLSTKTGEVIALRPFSALTAPELEAFAAGLPCPLPAELRELLTQMAGFEGGAADFVDFTGERCSFAYEAAFPCGLPIAADGFGNFWVVDLGPESRTWGPIYFACHDPPIILYQSPDLAHFLGELLRCNTPPYDSLVDDVHEDRIFDVWGTHPGVRSHAEVLAGEDAELRAFAATLDPSFEIVDLRAAAIGSGFAWGRYGPDTEVRRFGRAAVFAYRKPQRPRGWLARLFS